MARLLRIFKVTLKIVLLLFCCVSFTRTFFFLMELLVQTTPPTQTNQRVKVRNNKVVDYRKTNIRDQQIRVQELPDSNNSDRIDRITNPQREKYLIYYCTKSVKCCGWGDRQYGLLTVYVLSILTNRTFGVIMTSPCPITNFFHPEENNWIMDLTTLQGLPMKYLHTNVDKNFYELMKNYDFNAVYPQNVIYLSTNHNHFDDLKANPTYSTIFRKVFWDKSGGTVFADLWQHIFKLNERVVNRLNALLERAKRTVHHKLVCAHLRFGQNASSAWTEPSVRNTMDSVSAVWTFFNSSFRDPRKYKIFIASDSQQARTKAKELFPLQFVETEGETIHIDKTKNVTSDLCEGFMKVILEQYLLSKCDVLVLTQSHFGKAAAMMRQTYHNVYYLENGKIKPHKKFRTEISVSLDTKLGALH